MPQVPKFEHGELDQLDSATGHGQERRRSPTLPSEPSPRAARSLRLAWVDMLRGLAVALMVFFHFVWDLQYFALASVDVFSAPWQIFARGIGSSFIFLLGFSLSLRHQRVGLTTGYVLRRAGLLLGLGMLITLATYLFVGASYVRFGILHVLGASTLLALPFAHTRGRWAALVGAALIVAGVFIGHVAVDFPWLIWLGMPQAGVVMVDYYPLLPWSGIALLGLGAGRAAARSGGAPGLMGKLAAAPPGQALGWLGRHSLPIYLLHQPILIGLLLAAQTISAL